MQERNLIASGKTKDIVRLNLVRVRNRNDITAGDGEKHDVIKGKGELSTETTSNVFTLLKEFMVPVAYVMRDAPDSFIAEECSMIPLEVVWRAEAHGSALQRNPKLTRGHVFPKPVMELFLKTKMPRFQGITLPANDPLLRFFRNEALLYNPHTRYVPREPYMRIPMSSFFKAAERMVLHPKSFDLITINQALRITKDVGIILQAAFEETGYRLVDFKVEFGITESGRLVLADVIDNDSWRLIDEGTGEYVDKQVYRDGGNLKKVQENYELVSVVTRQFVSQNFIRRLRTRLA